jgi:hypothetical protein
LGGAVGAAAAGLLSAVAAGPAGLAGSLGLVGAAAACGGAVVGRGAGAAVGAAGAAGWQAASRAAASVVPTAPQVRSNSRRLTLARRSAGLIVPSTSFTATAVASTAGAHRAGWSGIRRSPSAAR